MFQMLQRLLSTYLRSIPCNVSSDFFISVVLFLFTNNSPRHFYLFYILLLYTFTCPRCSSRQFLIFSVFSKNQHILITYNATQQYNILHILLPNVSNTSCALYIITILPSNQLVLCYLSLTLHCFAFILFYLSSILKITCPRCSSRHTLHIFLARVLFPLRTLIPYYITVFSKNIYTLQYYIMLLLFNIKYRNLLTLFLSYSYIAFLLLFLSAFVLIFFITTSPFYQ